MTGFSFEVSSNCMSGFWTRQVIPRRTAAGGLEDDPSSAGSLPAA